MVVPATESVILVPFPFSDLSETKQRPAVVLAGAGRGDWVLCQITSNSYTDNQAITLAADDFQHGGLRNVSYARPGKLFTANNALPLREVGKLKDETLTRIVDAVVALLRRAS